MDHIDKFETSESNASVTVEEIAGDRAAATTHMQQVFNSTNGVSCNARLVNQSLRRFARSLGDQELRELDGSERGFIRAVSECRYEIPTRGGTGGKHYDVRARLRTINEKLSLIAERV